MSLRKILSWEVPSKDMNNTLDCSVPAYIGFWNAPASPQIPGPVICQASLIGWSGDSAELLSSDCSLPRQHDLHSRIFHGFITAYRFPITNHFLGKALDSFTIRVALLVFQKPGTPWWQMVYLALKELCFFTLVRSRNLPGSSLFCQFSILIMKDLSQEQSCWAGSTKGEQKDISCSLLHFEMDF